jgi:hypothetical protein
MKQKNKEIIIMKQLKTVNLFFIYIFVGNLFKSLHIIIIMLLLFHIIIFFFWPPAKHRSRTPS